jgi:two-component system chemotaxis response regulator CheV
MMDKVNKTTELSRRNSLALIVFKIKEKHPYYGINVFKTFEIQRAKEFPVSEVPSDNEFVEGIVYVRDKPLTLLNLPKWLGMELTEEEVKQSAIIFCSFNNVLIGLRVGEIHQILTRDWSEIKLLEVNDYVQANRDMNYTLLDDGKTVCMILDVEFMLKEIMPETEMQVQREIEDTSTEKFSFPPKLRHGTIMIAEDSRVAQMYLRKMFEKMKLNIHIFDNGKLLVEHIQGLEDLSHVPAIITDLEMPEMSGHTVIRTLKGDERTKHIPILVNSSMTGDNNLREVKELGADGFVGKTNVDLLMQNLTDLVNQSAASL